jgi:hypothetical protein
MKYSYKLKTRTNRYKSRNKHIICHIGDTEVNELDKIHYSVINDNENFINLYYSVVLNHTFRILRKKQNIMSFNMRQMC